MSPPSLILGIAIRNLYLFFITGIKYVDICLGWSLGLFRRVQQVGGENFVGCQSADPNHTGRINIYENAGIYKNKTMEDKLRNLFTNSMMVNNNNHLLLKF